MHLKYEEPKETRLNRQGVLQLESAVLLRVDLVFPFPILFF